ncbi:hypothetical protein GH714_043415 [Hevea brasiliensis]|uniref:Bidirectional sugar transporter SWEET n=1 Tax=Hevea brasiliensis TaxID=3981 RepID=A0A6A6K2X5_HEVBR|nr:hypothetical protein GH714_043415 [Hevea brasiliensis]
MAVMSAHHPLAFAFGILDLNLQTSAFHEPGFVLYHRHPYTFCSEDSVRVQVLGWICVAVSAQVIRTRSVEFMPFNLSFFLTISAIMWFVYGLFTKDMCVALPNVLGFILGLLQMLLYAAYRKAKEVIMEEQLPENLKTIVILSTLGNSEVHPVDIQPESIEGAKENEQKEEDNNNKEEEGGGGGS